MGVKLLTVKNTFYFYTLQLLPQLNEPQFSTPE